MRQRVVASHNLLESASVLFYGDRPVCVFVASFMSPPPLLRLVRLRVRAGFGEPMVADRRVPLLRASLVLALLSLALPGMAISADRPGSPKIEEEESITKGVEAMVADAKALALMPLGMDRYEALKLGGAVAVVGGLIAADHPLRTFVQRNTTSKGMDAANRVSDWLGSGPLLGYTAAAIAIGVANESYGGSSRLKEAGLVSFEAEGFAIGATSMLKFLTGRARPDRNQGATHFRPFTGLDTSFASTTAASSFALATVIAWRSARTALSEPSKGTSSLRIRILLWIPHCTVVSRARRRAVRSSQSQ